MSLKLKNVQIGMRDTIMQENKKWRVNYSEYSESDKGVENIGQAIVHVILALFVLGLLYTFFAKTEWKMLVKAPVLKTNTAKFIAEKSSINEKKKLQATSTHSTVLGQKTTNRAPKIIINIP
jgi:hypothetical protein